MLETKIEEKCILITGATSGIGETMARSFAEKGATVIAIGQRKNKLHDLETSFPEGRIYPYPYDLRDMENIENIFRFTKEKGLILDGMAHCAGIVRNSAIRRKDPAELLELMQVNLFSFFELGKYFYSKKYSKEGSSIVAISSHASIACGKGLSQYSASKAALNSLVRTMSKEFITRKIRVNAILPANVDTPMTRATAAEIEGWKEEAEQAQPLGFIEPGRIADLAEFLLSDLAGYMTGELIVVSGGMYY